MGSIFERNGGTRWVSAVVNDFYSNALSDAELSPFFKNISISSLIEHQIDFVSIALGKKTKYVGKSLLNAHKNLNISKRIFDRSVTILMESFRENGASYADLVEIENLVKTLEDQIVSKSIKGAGVTKQTPQGLCE